MRQPITEYQAKKIVSTALNQPYLGWHIGPETKINHLWLKQLPNRHTYVCKADQAVKQRQKKGLLALNMAKTQLRVRIEKWQTQGFTSFLIEPYWPHSVEQEVYLSLERTRAGIKISYNLKGGIDIEQSSQSLQQIIATNSSSPNSKTKSWHLPSSFLRQLIQAFNLHHFSFLEINPLVVTDNKVQLLDLAVEVDTAAAYFCDRSWNKTDYAYPPDNISTPEQLAIRQLAEQSQASFKFNLINPHGRIWVLLSGGGASIVLADEIYQMGFGAQLANYGEYSGGPSNEETYVYTRNLLSSLLKDQQQNKILIIGGGVANFTDVQKTFLGIIQALDEVKTQLRKQKLKVYVRRGGPNQAGGLQQMTDFLQSSGLYGHVSGPELPLTEIVNLALKN